MTKEVKCMGPCGTNAKVEMECPKCGKAFCDLCALAGGVVEGELTGRDMKKVAGGGMSFKGSCPYCGTELIPLRGTTKPQKKQWQFWK